MSGLLYIGAALCFGLFLLVGDGIMGLDSIVPGLEEFYEYVGWMCVGLGVFSFSVLVWLGKESGRIERRFKNANVKSWGKI